jgi:hypothetical protein
MTDEKEVKPRVTYAESRKILATRAGEYIVKHHPELTLADSSGSEECGPGEVHSYSFVLPYETPWWKRKLWHYARRRIAVLWFSHSHKASHGKWVLEVFGRKYVDRMRALAEELAPIFEIEIHVRLESELEEQEKAPVFVDD